MSDIAAQPERAAWVRPAIVLAKIAVCAVVLWYVGRALVLQFANVDWSQLHLAPVPALAAVACLLGVSVMQLVARWTLLLAYGYRLNWRVQVAAAWVPQLGKYVPGGFASVAGVVYVLRKRGVPGAVALSVAVLLDGMAVTAGFIVSTPLLLWAPVRQRMPLAWIGCLVMIVAGLVALHPKIFVGLLNLILKRFKRQHIDQVPSLGRYFMPVLASFGQWVFAGLALWFMTLAVTDISPRLIGLFIATAALAMTISYLMPLAPGGLGIREGIYLIALGPMLPAEQRPAVAIVVVAMRIVQTLMEVALAGFGAVALKSEMTPASPEEK